MQVHATFSKANVRQLGKIFEASTKRGKLYCYPIFDKISISKDKFCVLEVSPNFALRAKCEVQSAHSFVKCVTFHCGLVEPLRKC